jgi:hypothetical protein
MDQTYNPSDSGGTLQRKSRRRAALGSFPTTTEGSLPFVPMISLEEVQLSAGTVKILIMNVQLITGGDLLFLMDVIWMNRKWFLLRQHDEFIRLEILLLLYSYYCLFPRSNCLLFIPFLFSLFRIQQQGSTNSANLSEVLTFYRAWLTESPNATALIQHALAMKPEVCERVEAGWKSDYRDFIFFF